MSKVSNCCGAEDRMLPYSDEAFGGHYSDIQTCAECKEPCDYISQEDFDWLNMDDHDEPQDFSADLFKVMRETKQNDKR